ncbi:sensor histidine kinase [Sediminibacterium goheungense]|uniref:histidine kinase n=1 Tax=Sediminibacterium goheungense TaxID=1086393 RepID=A0A4R6J0D1_9BACT|nr:HAMP domain-containing sensor histidine kinase [Sediminibacterium goheungense]TDO28257.1 histidine kinase/DNA gyrase B/HSP90-like ATPase [Sediminibacterium goheungense]
MRINWRIILVAIAIILVSGTIFYSQYVAGKIATEERKYVTVWAEAQRTILNTPDTASLNLATFISFENKEIPILETTEKDSITGNYLNLDSSLVESDPGYLQKKLHEFRRYNNKPIVLVIKDSPYTANHYYYGQSKLLKEVKLYPLIQLVIVALFIAIAIMAVQSHYRGAQNQLWASMARETAHQLGTPVSSLEGWLEILKQKKENEAIIPEITKDVNRLLLITDRFGKIGSQPKLEPGNPYDQIEQMILYMKKRSGAQVQFEFSPEPLSVNPLLSAPLFDWVIENLIKNALDAMEGKGLIRIESHITNDGLIIDVTDSGKGIQSTHLNKVFKPGFTTKKRGWGLGLPLSKRIMEEYHNGKLFVKWSEHGKGTCFRIILPLPG